MDALMLDWSEILALACMALADPRRSAALAAVSMVAAASVAAAVSTAEGEAMVVAEAAAIDRSPWRLDDSHQEV